AAQIQYCRECGGAIGERSSSDDQRPPTHELELAPVRPGSQPTRVESRSDCLPVADNAMLGPGDGTELFVGTAHGSLHATCRERSEGGRAPKHVLWVGNDACGVISDPQNDLPPGYRAPPWTKSLSASNSGWTATRWPGTRTTPSTSPPRFIPRRSMTRIQPTVPVSGWRPSWLAGRVSQSS